MFRSSFTTRFSLFLLATTLLASLSGCQVPFLKPETMPAFVSKLPFITKPTSIPTTVDAACAARCDVMRSHCEQRQNLRESECQQHFKPTSTDHATCVTDNRGHCLQPVVCLGADLSLCKTQHEECLNVCRQPIPAPVKGVPPAPESASPQQVTAAVN